MTDKISETVFICSDLHLNILPVNRRTELLRFFSSVVKKRADRLYLNGDIFDFFASRMSKEVVADLKNFVELLYEISESGRTIHYNLGNHDLPLLLLLHDGQKERESLDVFHEHGSSQLKTNFFLNYRSLRFAHGRKQVYIEHGHIYDPGWTPSDNWKELFTRASATLLNGSFIETVLHIRELFEGLTDDSAYRMIKTGSELPVTLYASNEAQRLAHDEKVDWVILGHFHSPAIEEFKGGITYANSGDSWQHSNYLVLSSDEIRIGDWQEAISR